MKQKRRLNVSDRKNKLPKKRESPLRKKLNASGKRKKKRQHDLQRKKPKD